MPFQKQPIQDFIGKGLTFPIILENGAAKIQSGFDLIRSSILMILSWPLNRRFFLPEFGSRIEEILEEPNDEILRNLIRTFIVDAITEWEKRVSLIDVQIVDIDDKTINVKIRYRILNSQSEDSFIYPFYREIIQ